MINGENIRFDYAQHVMQGKTYLRNELSKLGELVLTKGGDTANKRIDWDIEKSHSNDAIVINDLTAMYPEKKQCNIAITEGKILKRYGIKSCNLLSRFNKIYWF